MKKKIGDYIVESIIGSGAYGQVYKGTNVKVPGEEYAIKMVSKRNMSEKVYAYLEREVEILQMFNHENVVRLKDIKATDNHYYLIFEYCNGGDLANYRKSKGGRVDQKIVRYLLRQIILGMDALYDKKAIHRDIKLSNILLYYPDSDSRTKDKPIVKLGDFGFARLVYQSGETDAPSVQESQIMSIVGTPLHMAPELFKKQKYSFKADIWSLGTIVYELLCGMNCYTGINKEDLINNINKGYYKISKELNLSIECMDFLNACLQLSNTDRIKWKVLKQLAFVITDNETPFVLDKFKENNPTIKDVLEDSKNYIFCSKVRYAYFELPKALGPIKEEEKSGDITKDIEEIKLTDLYSLDIKNIKEKEAKKDIVAKAVETEIKKENAKEENPEVKKKSEGEEDKKDSPVNKEYIIEGEGKAETAITNTDLEADYVKVEANKKGQEDYSATKQDIISIDEGYFK